MNIPQNVDRPGERLTAPPGLRVREPIQGRHPMSRDRTRTITGSNLPSVIDTALRASGHDPFTYRWVLLVEGLELDGRFLTAVDSNPTDQDLLYGPADLVDVFSRRLTALGGAL